MRFRDALFERGIDREQGILTESDREFLSPTEGGDPDNENTRNQKRYRIRRRVRNSMQDFIYLLRLSDEDYRLIEREYLFNKGEPGFQVGVLAAVQFLYRLVGEDELLRMIERLIVEDRKQDRPSVHRANINITLEEVENLELAEAAVEIMKELDVGDGARTEEVVETVIEREDVSREEAEQAIQDALFTGQCYEPDEQTIVPV